MINALEQYYLSLSEPLGSCTMAIRDYILASDPEIKAAWKYKAPFFTYKGRNICYIWKDKKTHIPYIGFIRGYLIDHPLLEAGERKQIRIMQIDPLEDLPTEAISEILDDLKNHY